MVSVGFLREADHSVIDGAGDDNGKNCTLLSPQQWTYNNAVFLYGAVILHSISGAPENSSEWLDRTKGLLSHATSQFFTPYANSTGVNYESQCEKAESCNVDGSSLKVYLSRWTAATGALVPTLRPHILSLLRPSSEGAALSCSGSQCRTKWYIGGYDGSPGVGKDMSALEVILRLLI